MIGDAVSVFITGLSKRNEVIIVLWAIFVIVNPKGGVDIRLMHIDDMSSLEERRAAPQLGTNGRISIGGAAPNEESFFQSADLFFTWILNHAPTLTKPEKKRFQECLQQKEVNSHKGTGSTHDYALDIL